MSESQSKADNKLGSYAVIKATGRSVVVREGVRLKMEYTGSESDLPEVMEFNEVMLVRTASGDKLNDAVIGTPYVQGASVKAKVVQSGRGKKTTSFKMRRTRGFTKRVCGRSNFVEVEVTEIRAN